jgi:hypothetical protein
MFTNTCHESEKEKMVADFAENYPDISIMIRDYIKKVMPDQIQLEIKYQRENTDAK